MSTFFNAAALGKDFVDQDQTGVIYVSSGVEIYGTQNISNAKITTTKTTTLPKKICKKISPKKYVPVAEQIIAKKNEEDRKLKILQSRINEKVEKSFYTSSGDSSFFGIAKNKVGSFAVSCTSFSPDFSNAILEDFPRLKRFETQLKKQKFYTSIAFLQFSRLRTSSLRAPPQLL